MVIKLALKLRNRSEVPGSLDKAEVIKRGVWNHYYRILLGGEARRENHRSGRKI